ncbi:MAG: ATP-binding protein [Acidimicrobiales bacterium]
MGGWLRRISFRVRLGTLVAVAVGMTLALASFASYVAVRHQLFSQVDSSLRTEVASATQLSPGEVFNANRVADFLHRHGNGLFQVLAPDGSVLIAPSLTARPLPVTQSQAALVGTDHGSSLASITYDGEQYRVLTEGGYSLGGAPVAIQVARPLSDINHSLSDLRLILWVVALSGIAVAVGAGYLVGRATMRPVVRLTAAAEHVAETQDLEARIDEDGDDELARLARSFNSMLSALAASRLQQAQLISDAGHELRTPLTSLRTNVEVLLRIRDLPPADRAALLSDVQAQLEEMTTLIGDVVELGREDEQKAEPIEIRLDIIVERAVQRARRRVSSVAFDLDLTAGSVRAQPALLERAVLNVLDNAAKWSSPGATVDVRLTRGLSWVLEVRDRGPGISPHDLPRVFDRFYRAEAARALPGSGLGLAIVREVVASHGGTVSISAPAGGGTVVRVELPTVFEHEPEPHPAGAALRDTAWSPM